MGEDTFILQNKSNQRKNKVINEINSIYSIQFENLKLFSPLVIWPIRSKKDFFAIRVRDCRYKVNGQIFNANSKFKYWIGSNFGLLTTKLSADC